MTKQEIIAKLKKNYIFKGDSQNNYESAKRLITEDLMTMTDPVEYEARIKIISDYLRI